MKITRIMKKGAFLINLNPEFQKTTIGVIENFLVSFLNPKFTKIYSKISRKRTENHQKKEYF